MFVHSFLYLIQKGYTEEASAFLKKWSPEHLEYHEDEIRSLTLIQTAEQLQVRVAHNARIPLPPCHRSPRFMFSSGMTGPYVRTTGAGREVRGAAVHHVVPAAGVIPDGEQPAAGAGDPQQAR